MNNKTSIEHLVKFPEIFGELNTTSSQDLIKVNAINQPKEMKKQTAVDYLFNDLIANPGNFIKAYKQAKEMEKEQMWEYIKKIYCIGHKSLEFHRLEFEQYYNETYKKEEK
jgi:hypothetical protein